jgi:hypothetical protein
MANCSCAVPAGTSCSVKHGEPAHQANDAEKAHAHRTEQQDRRGCRGSRNNAPAQGLFGHGR